MKNKIYKLCDNGQIYFIVITIWLITALTLYFLEPKNQYKNVVYPYMEVSKDLKTVKVFHKSGVVIYNFDERKTIMENEGKK